MPNKQQMYVPSLFGGISLQPAHVRFPHQVEDASNANFTIKAGCSKRPGSRYLGKFWNHVSAYNYRLHPIVRDSNERYIMAYGKSNFAQRPLFNIYEADTGVRANITENTGVTDYTWEGAPTADEMRLVSIADYTILVNTNVALATERSANYDITRVHNNYDALLAHTPAIDTYHQVQGDTTADDEYYQYEPPDDSDADATWGTRQFHVLTGSQASVDTSYYLDPADNPGGFNIRFKRRDLSLTAVTYDDSTKRLSKTGAFADYEVVDGDYIYIDGGTGITPGRYEVDSKIDDDTIEIATSAGSNASDVTTSSIDSDEFEVEVNFLVGSYVTMDDIAKGFQRGLQAAGAADALVSWTETADSSRSGYFTITSPYRGADSAVYAASAPTAAIYDHTDASNAAFAATTSTTTGTGTPDSVFLPPNERWVARPAPNQKDAKLDVTTMPVKLTRDSYTGDGSTPAEFSLSVIEWNDRTSGNTSTNPVPSLWEQGESITDIALHRNRLVLAGGQNVVFSQAGDLFNFFLDNATNVVDSDPIDLTLSSTEVALVDWIIPFRQSLVIFTKAGIQFELNAPDAMTSETAAITQTTAYKTIEGTRPTAIGTAIFFAGVSNGTTLVYEYFFDDLRAASHATDVTAHVAGLLPDEITSVSACQNLNMVFGLARRTNKVYIYRYFYAENSKQQSAWTVWEFDDQYIIHDIAVIENQLFLLYENDENYMVIEYINLDEDVVST